MELFHITNNKFMESWTESLHLTTVGATIKDDTGDCTTAEIQEYIEDCFEVEGEYLYTTTGAESVSILKQWEPILLNIPAWL
eukprot:6285647-Prymnesium_polylepis.1